MGFFSLFQIRLGLQKKLPPKKLEPWFDLWSFFLLKLLCISTNFYKSTIRPCMKYCCHVWAGASSCYLDMLDKLQKLICRTVGPSLAVYLEPLIYRKNVVSSNLFYRYYFGWCSSELALLVPLPYSWGMPTCYSDTLHDFSVNITTCYEDVQVNSFFPQTARLWNSLPIECFPYDQWSKWL